MAVSSCRKTDEVRLTKLWRAQREISPDGNVVWTETHNPKPKKVPVLYYLSSNGQLQHPHFMEVPVSSPRGLFLRDVIARLNLLRGKGMASSYSWSCKRRHKNGFVWHDLSETDLIYPAHGNEYVLKGSELPENAFPDVGSSSASQPPPLHCGRDDIDYPRTPVDRRRHNQSCCSIDIDYSVNKTESSGRSAAADASTRRVESLRNPRIQPAEEENGKRDEIVIPISPPPSDSSPETLETLMKAGGRVAVRLAETTEKGPSVSSGRHDNTPRSKSSVLMQLISCGSMPFKYCGAGLGLGLIGQYKMRAPRGGATAESGRGKAEEKEYFSGSSVETKKEEFPALRRSTSYDEDV